MSVVSGESMTDWLLYGLSFTTALVYILCGIFITPYLVFFVKEDEFLILVLFTIVYFGIIGPMVYCQILKQISGEGK